jgi:hypothetical protein
MENKREDEIRKQWEAEAKERQQQEQRQNPIIARPRKRLRELEYDRAVSVNSQIFPEKGVIMPEEMSEQSEGLGVGRSRLRSKKEAAATRGAATRARGKVTEILEGEDDAIELD